MAEAPQTPEARKAREWIGELDACEKWFHDYWQRCRGLIRRYKNVNLTSENNEIDPARRRFAILWSNIQTLGPAVYARTPEAVVTRRYKDSDPVGRYASEVLERAINFSLDQYDFSDMMNLGRDDYLLLGRGQAWVRYVPHQSAKADPQITNDAAQGEDDGDEEDSGYAEVCCDHVNNADWGFNPCREWDEASYVWRRVYMTRKELIERFGKKIGGKVPLDMKSEDTPEKQDGQRTRAKKAAIYEIWDKDSKEVLWISRGYTEGPLDAMPDPLDLEDFFPCPRPLMATTPQDQYIPVPDYVYYQDQAEEIDELTARIGTLGDALRMVGFYAGEENAKLQQMFASTNNTLLAVGSMASLADKGGLKGIVEWFPTDQAAKTLQACVELRKQLVEDVYQITGIADILRGATDPNETATAQGIKEQWGSLRVRDKQKELARFARDLCRIKGQIIAQKYQPQMLAAMTDVKLPTNAQKQAVQQAQQAQQLGAQPIPIPPDLAQIADRPSWEDVEALLKNDANRAFRVDIETDSTIEPNETIEKEKRVEFITAMSAYIGAAAQVIPLMPSITPLVGEGLKFLTRGFDAGREMEDAIERFVDQTMANPPAPPSKGAAGPTPEQTQLEQTKLQLEAQQSQNQDRIDQGNQQLEAQGQQLEAVTSQQNHQVEIARLQLDANQQRIDERANQNAHVVAMRPQPKKAG